LKRRSLADCHNILDLRERARHCLPSPVFHMMDGGAESELTARRNSLAFDDIALAPRCLVDVSKVKTATRVLGQDLEWPLLCAPTGASRLFHPDGELAVARAAAKAGILYSLSTASTYSLEEVVAATSGPKMFQLYVHKNRDLTRSLIERSKRAGYAALCLTVDVPAMGNRERSLRAGFNMPPVWTLRTALSYARRPAWVLAQMRQGSITLANLVDPSDGGGPSQSTSLTDQIDAALTWKDVREIADLWGGPLALKGVMSAEDARRAADAGVSAVIVSNHGGRQLDGAAAAVEALPKIARAVGDRIEVILDGGVRRGVHVLKALALGAKACSIGRPYLYGLSAGGEAGVVKALSILRTELTLAMQLSGCADVESIGSNLIWRSV